MKIANSESKQCSTLEKSIKGVLVLQSIVAIIVLIGIALAGLLFAGNDFLMLENLKASLYGSALAIISTVLTARSMRRTRLVSSNEVSEPGQLSMAPIFSGLLNKLVIVGGGIGFGLIIGLNPIYVVATYLIVQLSASAKLLVNDN